MNTCMYVCISMVLCSVSCLPLLFITLIVIPHRFICDCVYFFPFDCEPFVNVRIHIDYVCAFAALFLLSLLFLFAVLFYLYTVLGYVWVCNFPCLHLTFSVLLHAFWWWMLCLIVLFSVYFTSSSPYHSFFVCFCLCVCGFFFLLRHFILFSPLCATIIAIVMIVFIIVVFCQVRITFKCL